MSAPCPGSDKGDPGSSSATPQRPSGPPSPPPFARPQPAHPFGSRSGPIPPLGAGRGAAPSTSSLSLGLPRGATRGRGFSRGGLPGASSSRPSTIPSATSDASVRSTDNDALVSRLSAIRAGYLPSEPFSELLHSTPPDAPGETASDGAQPMPVSDPKRPPLINIGTFLRCTAIDRIVEHFLTSDIGTGEGAAATAAAAAGGMKKQIISLGAGSDARFWRLKSRPELFGHLAKYVELDFEDITRAKAKRIFRHRLLFEGLEDVEEDGSGGGERTQIRSKVYALLPCDLRQLANEGPGLHAPSQGSSASASQTGARLGEIHSLLSPDLPTLILAECVLAYLPARSSDNLLAALARHFERPSVLSYDICVAGDGAEVRGSARAMEGGLRRLDEGDDEEGASRFGRVMLQNLETRGLLVPGARSSPTPSAHARKLRRSLEQPCDAQASVYHSGSKSLRSIWRDVGGAEKSRLSRLEGLDEVEELEMLLGHYAIAWASRSRSDAEGRASKIAGLDERVEDLLRI